MGRALYRTKYLLSFSLALVAAFFTYRTFMAFKASAEFTTPMLFLNTVIFLLLWFISFTSHSEFVKENIVLVLIIPAAGVYITNIMVFFNSAGASFLGFLKYVAASITLLFASYESRKYEELLRQKKGRFS